MKVLLIIFTMFTLFVISCSKDEYEIVEETFDDNTYFTRASEIKPNTRFIGYTRRTENEFDKDFIKVVSETPGLFDIEVKSDIYTNVDLFFTVHDENHENIKSINDFTPKDEDSSGGEAFHNFYSTSGIFYIRVSLSKIYPEEVKYSIFVKQKDEENYEKEPNDKIDIATPIEINSTMEGSYGLRFDYRNTRDAQRYQEYDYFLIDTSDFDFSTGDAAFDIELTFVPEVDSILSLVDKNARVVSSSDIGGVGESEVIKDIAIGQNDKYYILVYGKNAARNTKFNYRLSVLGKKYSDTFVYEPNNTEVLAMRLNPNIRYEGKIDNAKDIDVFALFIDRSGNYTFDFNFIDEPDNMSLTIRTLTGDTVFSTDFISGGIGEKSIPLNLNASKYYIYVDNKGTNMSSYTIQYSEDDRTYEEVDENNTQDIKI